MAELDAQLRLDIDQALRDIGQLETALDRALTSVELRVDTTTAQREIEALDDRINRAFDDVSLDVDPGSSAQLESNLAGVERNLRQSEGEAEDLTRELRRAEDAADDIDVAASGLAGSFGNIRTAALGIGTALAAIGGAQVFGAAVRGANFAIQAYAELADSINAVNVVFREGSDAVIAFGQDAAQSAGLSEFAFNQAVAPIGAVLTNFGFSAREAADAATVLVQRGADLASVYGGTVQDAVLSITSALVGQVEPLRRFGGEISQARVEAFALATGLLQAGEEMDTATAVQARYGLILKDTAVVQGDFLNTADDLANAQRILSAEVQNLVGQLGEALAPALESILAQSGPLLAFFESLIPALGETAQAAAEAGAGLAATASGITLGLGQLPDLAGGLGDVAQGFVGVIDAIVSLDPTFADLNTQIDQFSGRVGDELIRVAAQSIPQAMQTGSDALDAFANSIAFLGRQDDSLQTIQQSFQRLATVAGLSGRDLQKVTGFLIQNAAQAGLSAEEIAFLRGELARLTNELDPNIEALRQQAFELLKVADVAPTAATGVDLLATAAEAAGVGMAEFAVSGDPLAAMLFNALDPMAQLEIKLEAVRSGAITVADAFTSGLTPSVIDAGDALIDFNDDGRVSLGEFITGLGEATTAALEFQTNLLAIFAISPELATAIQGLPEDVALEMAREFAANPLQIPIAEKELLDPVGVAKNIQTLVLEAMALVTSGAGAQQIADFTTFVTTLDLPGGEAAVLNALQFMVDGATSDLIAPDFTPKLVEGVEAAESELQTAAQDTIGFAFTGIDVSEQGIETMRTFFSGMYAFASGETGQLQQTLVGVLDGAIQRQSPPKIFLDAGIDSGEAFWSGFEQADLQLKVPTPAFSGSIQSGTASAPGGGSGGDVIFNLPALDTRDADVTIARAGQIGGQVVGILNGRFHL